MLEPANLLKIAHAIVGVWFLAGLIGRWVTLGQAARTAELASMQQLLALGGRFERMVVTGSLGVLELMIAKPF